MPILRALLAVPRRLRIIPAAAWCVALVLALPFAAPAQAQFADLVVNHSDSPDPGPAGGVFTYTVRVDNNGPDAAIAVVLSDTLPPGSSFVGVTTTQGSCSHAAGTVACTLGDIAFLANVTVTIQVVLPSAGVWTNTATATSSTTDPNTANNLNVTEDTTAQAAADLALSAVDSPDPIATGANYNYALTATNNGPNALAGAQTIAFTVATGSCVRSVPTGTGWSCTPSTGYPLCSGSISCTRTAALAVGASAPVLTVPAVANVSGAITAAFAVSAPMPDGNTANNTAIATTTVTGGSSDVSITKTRTPATVAIGSNVTYTLTPRLNGGEPPGTLAPNLITVTDTLNAALTFVSANGTGWTCGFSAPTVTCTRPGPYTGGPFTNMPVITLVAQVTASGVIPNTATISAPEVDPAPGNNSSSANVTGGSIADMRMTKTASANPVVTGAAFNYTLTVRNQGPTAVMATNTITATDALPAGIELTGPPAGAGWTCTPNAGFPLAGPFAVNCSRSGPLAINTNAPTITVPVRATSSGTIVNNACVVLTGSGASEGEIGNNCSSVSLGSAGTQADLELVSKTANPNPVLAGQNLTYVITVRNNSVDPSTNVTVTDTLANLVTAGGFQSAVPSQGSCTPSGVTPGPSVSLSCNLGTLAGGATATITIVVRPTIPATGNRNNGTSVTSPDVVDPVPGNNSREVNSTVTAVADVAVTKTATPSPVQAGTPLTYVVTVVNNGPSNAQNLTINDSLPPGTAFVQLVSVTAPGICTVPAPGATSGTISCSWPVIGSSQRTATFVVRPLTASAGGNVDNTVTVASTTIDNTPANNTFTTSTPVTAAQVDILVNKVDSVDPVALGLNTVYTVTVTNGGPSHATNVVLVDTFPSGSPSATFSYQGGLGISPPAAGSCVEPGIGATSGTLACTFPGLASGASAVVTYTMRAEAITAGASGTTFNAASVTADEPETLPANNATVHATTTRRTADLAIVKSAPATFTPGSSFAWTLAVTNNGPNDSSGAVVSDTLPAGVAFLSASAGCGFAAGTVTCTLGALPVGSTSIVTINVLPSSPYTGGNPLSNTATVAVVNEVDPAQGNNSSTATSIPGASVTDLSLVKTGPASVLPGAAISWQLAIANGGPSAAHGAAFSDTLPAGVGGVTASCGGATGGAVCGPVNVAPGTVSGSITTLPSGGTVVITINATAPLTGPLFNAASVTAPPGAVDPALGNNNGSVTTTIPLADLTIVKVANGSFMQGQVGATYTLTVTNVGPGPTIAPASVTDALPAGLSATAIAGTGWTCVLATLTCTRADLLSASASYPPITLTVDLAANAPANLVNAATVSGGGETNVSNNTSSVTTPVTPVLADLTIVKVANGSFMQGQSGATYTLTVTNVGAGPTTAPVSVTDTLPVGLSATGISGTGWTCVLATLTCTRADVLAASASYPPITLTVNVAANSPASVVNTASVSGGGETNTSNNVSSVTTPVTPLLADLTIVKVANGTFTQGQVGATYTLTVTNAGAAPTTAPASVTDTLPVGLSATAIAGTGWTCVLATLTCTRADVLAASASYPPITLTVNVAANSPTPVVNTTTVSGGGETNTGNNVSSVTTPVTPLLADLTIVKVANGTLTQGQVGATYTLTVTNVGAGPTTAPASVTDTLPVGLSATAMSGTGWTCVLATLTCTRADVLAASASYPPITLTVNIAANSPTPVVNTTTVSGGGETNTSNNTSSVETPVTPLLPDLTIVKVANGTFVLGQVGATYTLTITNTGAGTTVAPVSVSDTLPAGLSATAISGAGWTCVLATLTCTRADVLAPSASYPPIALTVNVAANAPASLINRAMVTGGGETNASNNTSTATTLLVLAPGPVESIPTLSTAAVATLGLLILLVTAYRSRPRARLRRWP